MKMKNLVKKKISTKNFFKNTYINMRPIRFIKVNQKKYF